MRISSRLAAVVLGARLVWEAEWEQDWVRGDAYVGGIRIWGLSAKAFFGAAMPWRRLDFTLTYVTGRG